MLQIFKEEYLAGHGWPVLIKNVPNANLHGIVESTVVTINGFFNLICRNLPQNVALWYLAPSCTFPESSERLTREARLLAKREKGLGMAFYGM